MGVSVRGWRVWGSGGKSRGGGSGGLPCGVVIIRVTLRPVDI